MFRFTIRDGLWLTVVVALGCAWSIHHNFLLSKLRIAHHDIQEAYFRMGLMPSPFV
jgi:hypothetical protein